METSKIKKGLSLIMAIIMIFTMVPVTVFTLGADESYPMMMQFTAASSGDFHKYYDKVYSVTFLDSIDAAAMAGAIETWDVSATQDGSVMGWMYLNDEATATAGANRYDVYIAGEGGVGAHPQSGFIFYLFTSLEEVDARHFKTDNATTFISMFENCYKLRKVDFSGWNTENVTSMESMFRNCHILDVLDLRSFDTSKVTSMKFMFYLCKKLKHIYVADGWTTDSIADLYDGVFNCCYAIVGGTDDDKKNQEIYESNPNPPISGFYANCEEGGYLTYKALDVPETKEYKVTYSFTGDIIPDGVTAPVEVVYKEGTTVTVEANPIADGYIFSGWTTTDATVENGQFVINNDVHFVGSWEKLYNVYYKYDENFPVPDGAPTADMLEVLNSSNVEAGEYVGVAGVMPTVPDYIFVGWYTKDAEIVGDEFEMPAKDVTLYGYYKKPVESVEIIHNEDVFEVDFGDVNEDELPKLNVYVRPDDATIKDLVYTSEDETIVKIDEYGKITPVGVGTTTITVQSVDDPTKSDTITVVVKNFVTDVSISDMPETTLNKGDKDKITGTVNEDATNKEVGYKSDDETIVKVDENGNIEAVGEGTTTITVYSKDNPEITETVTITVKIPVTDITATEDFTLEVGDIKNLEATVDEDATNKELIYESSNSGVVKVDSNGDVIAVGEGEATITITSKDNPSITETVKVTVIKKYKVIYEYIGEVIPEGAEAPEEAVYVSGSEVTVEADHSAEGYIFSGWSTADNADIQDGRFKIYNDVHFVGSWSKIKYYDVTYRYDGDIPANAPKVPVKVTYEEGKEVIVAGKPASVDGYTFTGWDTEDAEVTDGKFNIYNNVEFVGLWSKIPVSGITADKDTFELTEGETEKITVTVTPDNAADKEVTFKSDDETVVKVDENGNITAVGEGTATITITSKDDPSKTETVTVTVKKPFVPVEDIIVDKNSIQLTEGGKDKITVTVTPDDATNKEVTFKSDDETVVKVDEDGNVTAVGEGVATITVTSKDGSVEEIVIVLVKKPIIPAEDIIVDKTDIKLEPGKTDKITVTVKPDNTTDKEVTFQSDNESVVKVDKDGNITAIGEGTATITVTSKDGTVKETVTVTVENPPVKITAPEKITIVLGEETEIGASINADATLTYTNSDENIVKVDETGKITAVGEGTATITVTGAGVSAVITVVVTAKPAYSTKHYMVFGKTEKIGWYNVSLDGGETILLVFGNSHLEVEHGQEVIIRANDVLGDPFTFYINGKAVKPDDNGYVRVIVDKYVLVGALGIPIEAPDVEESLNFFQRIIQAIKNFFAKITSWFKK